MAWLQNLTVSENSEQWSKMEGAGPLSTSYICILTSGCWHWSHFEAGLLVMGSLLLCADRLTESAEGIEWLWKSGPGWCRAPLRSMPAYGQQSDRSADRRCQWTQVQPTTGSQDRNIWPNELTGVMAMSCYSLDAGAEWEANKEHGTGQGKHQRNKQNQSSVMSPFRTVPGLRNTLFLSVVHPGAKAHKPWRGVVLGRDQWPESHVLSSFRPCSDPNSLNCSVLTYPVWHQATPHGKTYQLQKGLVLVTEDQWEGK